MAHNDLFDLIFSIEFLVRLFILIVALILLIIILKQRKKIEKFEKLLEDKKITDLNKKVKAMLN